MYNIHLTNRGFLIWRTTLQLKRPSRLIGNPSSVFCLLSPVSCLLPPVFCPIRPSCPACRRSTIVERALQIVLFSQNKPNPLKAKTNATTCFTKSYEDKPPRPARKNKPKQTQSPHPAPPLHASRFTRYDIRHTNPNHPAALEKTNPTCFCSGNGLKC